MREQDAGVAQLRRPKAIYFAPVASRTMSRWGRPRCFAFVRDLSMVPLADSELLLASHHLPVVIDGVADDPRVVAVTHPRLQRTPLISAEGRWTRGYMPIALRSLPFRLKTGSQGQESLEVATNLEPEQSALRPLFSGTGALTPEVEAVLALLRRLESSRATLQSAAEKLLMADVMAPFQLARLSGSDMRRAKLLTVDHNRFAALSPSRTALLVKDGFLPIDLAMACIFSQRLMATLIALAPQDVPEFPNEKPIDWAEFAVLNPVEVQIDDGELFSFDAFLEGSRSC